jgi:hypothetical protein
MSLDALPVIQSSPVHGRTTDLVPVKHMSRFNHSAHCHGLAVEMHTNTHTHTGTQNIEEFVCLWRIDDATNESLHTCLMSLPSKKARVSCASPVVSVIFHGLGQHDMFGIPFHSPNLGAKVRPHVFQKVWSFYPARSAHVHIHTKFIWGCTYAHECKHLEHRGIYLRLMSSALVPFEARILMLFCTLQEHIAKHQHVQKKFGFRV